MERPLQHLYQSLQKLIGLHRQLLDTVRMEHDALVNASIKDIQEAVLAKQALVDAMAISEHERQRHIAELAIIWKKPARELTISAIIIAIQGRDPKAAEQFRSSMNALTVLVKRVGEQNEGNRALVERSLGHIQEMKRNVLGEAMPRTEIYGPKGNKQSSSGGARFLSKEV